MSNQIYYDAPRTWRADGSIYTQTGVSFFVPGDLPESLITLQDMCVDNKAGYGTIEAAERMHAYYTAAIAEGFTHSIAITYGARVSARWQHYDHNGETDQYCSPRVDVGDEWRDIERNLKLAKRVAGKVFHFPQSPSACVERLRACRAKEITLWRYGGCTEWLVKRSK